MVSAGAAEAAVKGDRLVAAVVHVVSVEPCLENLPTQNSVHLHQTTKSQPLS